MASQKQQSWGALIFIALLVSAILVASPLKGLIATINVSPPTFENAQFQEIDWANASFESVMLSMRHQEAPNLVAGLHHRSEYGTLRMNNPQGCQRGLISSGTVCMFLSFNAPEGSPGPFTGHLAILMGSGPHVAFFVINTTVARNMWGQPGWKHLGDGFYMNGDPAAMAWKCAWWMASHLAPNGKTTPPEEFWLDAGAGWQKWEMIRSRYGYTYPIAEISLPKNPFLN